MAEQSRPDLCVVGAGALGIALAQHARSLGADVVLVDRGFPEPGDAVERATHVAALQASAARAHALRNAGALGLANGVPKFSMKSVQERARNLVADLSPVASRERLTALGIRVVAGETRFIDPGTLSVGGAPLRCGGFVLATGSRPMVPAIPGLDQVPFFTLNTVLDNARKLTHLLVIGDDPAGYAMAQMFARLGSEVTLVPRGTAVRGFDREAVDQLLAALSEEGVRVVDGGDVVEISPRSQGIGASLLVPNSEREALDLSHILVADGWTADLEGLDIGKARLGGANANTPSLAVGDLGETRNRRIRVAGVAAGIAQWHHALRHGRGVVEVMLGASRPAMPSAPKLVPTEPALVEIGSLPIGDLPSGQRILRASFSENLQAQAMGEARGLVKVVVDARDQLVGASLVGPGAAEMAGVLAMAMENRLPLGKLAELSMPHPSLMSSLVTLSENLSAPRHVSVLTNRWRAVRRTLPF